MMTKEELLKAKQWIDESSDNMELIWLRDEINELFEHIEGQQKKLEKYENALKFYAKKDYYEPFKEEDEDRIDAFNLIDLDGGDTAREALKELQNK